MKKVRHKLLILAVVVAGVGWGITPAGAVVTSYNGQASGAGGGDIFVAFQATDAPGNTYSYLVKLTTRDFLSSLTSAHTFNVGTILADLSQDIGGQGFGANWATRDDLYWGVFGVSVAGSTSGSIASVYFASRARVDAGVQSAPWSLITGGSSGQADVGSAVTSLGGSYAGKESTSNSDYAIWQSNSLPGSYAARVPTNSGFAFSSFAGWVGFEESSGGLQGSFANGASGTVLDFYQVNRVAESYLGYFTINDNAQITFNPVPEPSVFALIALGGTVSLVFRRRRSAARQIA